MRQHRVNVRCSVQTVRRVLDLVMYKILTIVVSCLLSILRLDHVYLLISVFHL